MTARGTGRSHPVDAHGDPLTLALAGLLADAAGTVREYAIHDVLVSGGDELRVSQPVAGRVRLSRTNRGLVLEARFRTALDGECARCLRPLVSPVEVRIDEEVLPSIDLATGLPVPLEEGADPEAPRLTGHHELELRPLVLEAISLAEPIAPLCEPDCPGLCAECGARLEAGHVAHETAIDPRLEVLRGFRVDGDADSG